jgi:hypothetical protein
MLVNSLPDECLPGGGQHNVNPLASGQQCPVNCIDKIRMVATGCLPDGQPIDRGNGQITDHWDNYHGGPCNGRDPVIQC